MAQISNSNSTQCNTSMYKSLCICSPEFEKIPIHRRELGMARNVATYEVNCEVING